MKKEKIEKGLSIPVKRRSGFLLVEAILALLLISFTSYVGYLNKESEILGTVRSDTAGN